MSELTPVEDVVANDSENEPSLVHEEHRTLKWAALVATIAIAWLVMPIGIGILLGMLLAFVVEPLHRRVKGDGDGRWSALAIVLATMVGLLGTLSLLVWLLATKGVSLTRELIALVGPGGQGAALVAWVGGATARVGITPDGLMSRARDLAEEAASAAARQGEYLLGALTSALLASFFAVLTMHSILRNWERMTLHVEASLPLRPAYTRALFDELRRVGRSTLMGTVVTGLVQGLLATVGYWIAGIPEPLFFGAATAVASLVPAVGTLLVWVPAGIVLLLTGHLATGIFELAWGGLLVVALSDYFIRPRLVGGESELPSLVMFAALFGGVEVLGLKGLIVGPVLMSLAVAVLRLYARETRLRRLAPARDH